MVVDPGGEWEEGRVGGVVVVGGDGCRPRGVGGGERKASAPERGLGRRKELETWHSVVSAALWPLHDVGLWP